MFDQLLFKEISLNCRSENHVWSFYLQNNRFRKNYCVEIDFEKLIL